MYRKLSRTEALIQSSNLHSLVEWLLQGGEEQNWVGNREIEFSGEKQGRRAQRLLYEWLWFHPQIKNRVSLRLEEGGLKLLIKFRSYKERRGRRGMK